MNREEKRVFSKKSLIDCIQEMEIGIDSKRRLWFVIDELPALGKLPALSPIMAEGRKYGACVLAGLQSLNQLYSQYGYYDGSAILGQFGTSFFFNNKEPAITKMISSICGIETITRQQKNTSYGANEFRDGVSYSEHQEKQPLVTEVDLADLSIGKCYTLLPEPRVRLSKMQIPASKVFDKNIGFVAKTSVEKDGNIIVPLENNHNLADAEKLILPTCQKVQLMENNQQIPDCPEEQSKEDGLAIS